MGKAKAAKGIRAIAKVAGTLIVLCAFVCFCSEPGEETSEMYGKWVLWEAGCVAAVFIGYKLLVWADPSLLRKDNK